MCGRWSFSCYSPWRAWPEPSLRTVSITTAGSASTPPSTSLARPWRRRAWLAHGVCLPGRRGRVVLRGAALGRGPLFQRVGIDGCAHGAGDGQGRRHEQEGVATVSRAVGGQLLEKEDLPQGETHIRNRHHVERIPEAGNLGRSHLHRVVVAANGGDLLRV